MEPIIGHLGAVPGCSITAGPGIGRQINFAHLKVEVCSKAIVGASAHGADGLTPGYSLAFGYPAFI